MTKLLINGGKKLEGTLPIFGAKNASLPIICACLLSIEESTLHNIPNLKDIEILGKLINNIGFDYLYNKDSRTLKIKGSIQNTNIGDLANKMRASLLLMGPLLAAEGKVKIPYPGGCKIGGRPIDVTLDGFKALGVDFEENEDFLIASTKKLKGCDFNLKFPSVTATENLIMAATLAEGTTVFTNVAKEPEIVDLIDFLNKMGADIKAIDNQIIINGVEKLYGTEHNIIPDRIITGTYTILAALCAGKNGILINNCNPEHIKSELDVLIKAGVKLEINNSSIFVPEQQQDFNAVDFETDVYDGFATDLQAPMMLFLTQAHGSSKVRENIYENRFMHIEHLNNMSAEIKTMSNHLAIVNGPKQLTGANVRSTDLRASAALVIAGLIANGQTIVDGIVHLDRGYETLDLFLQNIGADVKRIEG